MEAMLELRDWLDAGGVAGLLADRDPAGTGPARGRRRPLAHPLDRFSRDPAAFSDGAFRLAALLRRPVVFMAGLYLGGGRYQLRFAPVADFSETPVAVSGPDAQAGCRRAGSRPVLCATAGQQCRATPHNWFNFFDFWAGSPGPQDASHASPDSP
jgi:predicted LPLAT superfamily acyltransferase